MAAARVIPSEAPEPNAGRGAADQHGKAENFRPRQARTTQDRKARRQEGRCVGEHPAGLGAGFEMAAILSASSRHQPAPNGLFNGLIWPKAGCASIAYGATAASQLSSPAGFAVIPRETRKLLLCCQAPAGCAVDRLRPVDRHRGRNGAGSTTETEI